MGEYVCFTLWCFITLGYSWGYQHSKDFSEASKSDSTHVSDMDDFIAALLTS